MKELKSGSVAFGYIHNLETTEAFAMSMTAMFWLDARSGRNLFKGVLPACGGHHAMNREKMARGFMESGCDWLLSVDTNSEFQADSIIKLLAVADPVEKPIVVPLFVSRPGYAPLAEDNPLVPMWYEKNERGGYEPITALDNAGMQRIDAAGMAMYLVHKSVFERFPLPEEGRLRWFGHDVGLVGEDYHPEELSEDLTFFSRCGKLGIPVWGCSTVHVTHLKKRREMVRDLGL